MPVITDCISKISTRNFCLKGPNKNIVKDVLAQNIIVNKYPRWQLMARTIQDTLLLGESAVPINAKTKKNFSFRNLNPFRYKNFN